MLIPRVFVVGSPVTALPSAAQVARIREWAAERSSRVVCVANVHMIMEAHWGADFAGVLERADLVTPDGMPLVWVMRRLGQRDQDRLPGLDIFLEVCRAAEIDETPIYFLGSTEDVLLRIESRLRQEFPELVIAGIESPPFRPLTPEEDEALVARINASNAGAVFVALGCPKQERWMDDHRGRIHAVMIGLGGVFPVYAGIQKRAPALIRNAGLEWAYRLAQEPERLWRRYRDTNIPFILLALRQLALVRRNQP